MTTNITANPFNLPINAYAAFDASNLKSLMIQRLNEGGVFTDQIYEGSNFNSLLDVIAYSYNVLLFYLNKTASESVFSQAQLYENMSRIVKLLNYNPSGYQTSILTFEAVAPSTLPAGVYTIPRYSYFTVNGISYTFTEDASFTKETDLEESLPGLANTSVLFQGTMIPYPVYIANGAPYEEFSIVSNSDTGEPEIIDHSSIHVYVTNELGRYEKWDQVNSLYLQTSNSKTYECRINENQNYIIKFGNDINGKQLLPNSVVSVFYLKSDGAIGQIGPRLLDGNKLFLYNQSLFNRIFNDVKGNATYLTSTEAESLVFTNPTPSTAFKGLETVNDIRQNAPNIFKTQYRLVTTDDFETYIKNTFGNFINDVSVLNNWEYLAEHVRYLYNLGLKAPNNDSRVLFNQVTFADSCDFNNLYIYIVPKIQNNSINSSTIRNNFLNTGLKDKIITQLQNLKMATSELIIMDPVYIAVTLGVASTTEINNKQLTTTIGNETYLTIGRSPNSRLSENEIKSKITNIFKEYFSVENCKIGQTISISYLAASILSIDGVTSLITEREVNGQQIVTSGLSLLMFNPVYSEKDEDIGVYTQNLLLPNFKIPYLYNADEIFSHIKVVTPDTQEKSLREY